MKTHNPALSARTSLERSRSSSFVNRPVSEFAQPFGERALRVGLDSNRILGRYCLNAFLVIGWFVASSKFIALFAGERLGGMIGLYGLLVYPGFLAAAVFFYERSRHRGVRLWTRYLTLLLVCVLALAIYGAMRGNATRVMVFDVIGVATVFGAFVLGRRDEVWEDARTVIVVLTGVSVVTAILYTDSLILTNRSIINEQAGSHFEASLVLAPIFCIAAVFDRRVWRYFLLLALTMGCLFVHIYLGRRGISLWCAFELLIAAFVLPFLLGKQRRTLVTGGLIAGFAMALVFYFPFGTLINRYLGSYGIVVTVITENERWNEMRMMIDEFSPVELVIGRGIGGAFLVNNAEEIFASDIISGEDVGRIVTHAGAGLPVLKGGLVFWAVYFFPVLILLTGVFRWRQLDPLTLAALGAASVMFPFQFVDGAPTYSTPWLAFGIGLVMSRAQNAMPDRLPRRASRPDSRPIP